MAGGSAGSLFVDLLLRDSQFQAGLRRGTQGSRNFSNQIRGDFNKASVSIGSVLSPVENVSNALRNMAGTLAATLSVQKIIQYADSWKSLESRLSLVTENSRQLEGVQRQLFDIAQATRTPLQENIAAYSRLAGSLNEYQRQSYDLVRINELLSKTLRISGSDATASATFFQQFGQAASSDFKAIGQELQTFADQNPRLYAILRAEAATTGKSLKDLAADGELSFDRVAKAILAAGAEIDREAGNISLTVGQAITQLDNALLRYVGNSEAAQAGTSSLALAISGLAQNFDLVAKVGLLAVGVLTARLIPSMLATVAATAASSLQFNLQVISMVRASGASTALAVSLRGLAVSSALLGRGLALLGGPIGIAVLGAFALMTFHTDAAGEASLRYGQEISKIEELTLKLSRTSGDAHAKTLAEITQRTTALNDELAQLEKLILSYGQMGKFEVALREYGSYLPGMGAGPLETIKQYQSLKSSLEQLNAPRDPISAPSAPASISKEQERAFKKQQDHLASLYKQNREYIQGLDSSTIKYNDTLGELNELLKAGTIDQTEYDQALKNLRNEFDKTSESAGLWGLDFSEVGKDAARNTQSAFADFLFDPFESGMNGMVKGFTDTVRRMIAEAQAAQLAKTLFGSLGGGVGAGILGSVFGSQGSISRAISGVQVGPLPSFGGMFADGGVLEPGHWGIVGENGPERIYAGNSAATIIPNGGGAKGNTYMVDARGADNAAVARLEKALLTLAGPGVIERRVINGQQRGEV